ncbi:hypothetical protein EDD85DRAFT_946670 [Armillaria nabsnona]|nr:hypothetical protein EDD85DRAFT_946670 [Armillaria nabsnona]
MLRLERRPNEGPYLVATGVPPQLFDEWSTYDSAYHMLYDHDSQSVFSFHDPSPQHAAAIPQFLGAFERGYTKLYLSKLSDPEFDIQDYLHIAGSSAESLRDGSLKEPDARIEIVQDNLQELTPCLVFECAYMNEDEATLVSETLRWAACGYFSVSLKIQNVAGWPTSPRLTFYTADRYGTVVTRYTVPHDAVDPRGRTRRGPATSLESIEHSTDVPPASPGAYFLAKLDKVPESEGEVGKLDKCYKMLGLSPKLSKHISIFEQLRAQQKEECQEYYFEESDDEGDAGGSGEAAFGTDASSEDDDHLTSSDEYSHPQRHRKPPKDLYAPHLVTVKKRPPLLEREAVKDGVLVDGCCIPISLSALYGDNTMPSPLSPDDRLLLDVFTIRTHISYAISRLVRYTEKLRRNVDAVEGTA